MNSSYQQLVSNLEYLNLKQMITHLNDTIDFSTKNELSLVDTLMKLTNYEIDVRE
ncbi:transposase, partial [Metabacillus litoralis]|nr:transposase [Metabacillus litoralis]